MTRPAVICVNEPMEYGSVRVLFSAMDTNEQTKSPKVPETATNLLRGGLIGIAETVPGVSGGTVALVTGIYERLIFSAYAIVRLPKMAMEGNFKRGLKRVDWKLLFPLGIGMVAMVFIVAGYMESFVTNHPTLSNGLFFGMILISVIVPLQEIRPSSLEEPGMRTKAIILFVVFAIGLFLITSLPSATLVDPPWYIIFGAAAIAISALLLPGMSGSFFLLLMGLYAPTLAAVDNLDFGYIGIFMLGAITGVIVIVRVLERLLTKHHTLTMAAAAGLLLGSLRALWPWQTEDGGLMGIGDDWFAVLGMVILGIVIVGGVALLQRRFSAGASAR